MVKILMVIKTSSIDYDERLKKEVESLLTHEKVRVSIFAIEDKKSNYNNKNIEIYNPKFVFRNQKTITKIFTLIELLIRLRTKFKLHLYDKIWVHDPIMIILIPFINLRRKREIIWDLHELPPEFFVKRKILKWVFRRSASLCKTIIVANQERGDYMVKENLIKQFKVINNYPDLESVDNSDYSDSEFDEWIKDKEFSYCQSATHPSRNFLSLAQACVNTKQYLVVVGEKNHVYLQAKNSIDGFDDYIIVLGKKPSDRLNYYISKAKFSFIFYSNINMNNYLCAPNRMYHSIKLSVPVIVGANPTMKNFIEENNCGITLLDYGESNKEIEKAVIQMNNNYKYYLSNTEKISDKYSWSDQNSKIEEIIS